MSCKLKINCGFVDDIGYISILNKCGQDSTRWILKLWDYLARHNDNFIIDKKDIDSISFVIGIPKDNLNNLFEVGIKSKFFRVSNGLIDVGRYVQKTRSIKNINIRRFNIMPRYMPDVYDILASSGIKSISKDDFERLKQADDKVAMAKEIVREMELNT